jgi:riboflavin synthase
MYAGIVEGIGRVIDMQVFEKKISMQIEPQFKCDDLILGDSISVNGVCLTMTTLSASILYVDIVQQTIEKTNLGQLEKNSPVNLARCVRVGDRIGGHFVSGHIDSLGKIIAINPIAGAYHLVIQIPSKLIKFIAAQGSVTIDGMSLTIVNVFDDCFSVTLIPYTLAHTIASQYSVGTQVNIEVDMLAKYLDQLTKSKAS